MTHHHAVLPPTPAPSQVKLLGYGEGQLLMALQLAPGPARTDPAPLQVNCLPFVVPATAVARRPGRTLAPDEFFKQWAALPVRAEVAGAPAPACLPAPAEAAHALVTPFALCMAGCLAGGLGTARRPPGCWEAAAPLQLLGALPFDF